MNLVIFISDGQIDRYLDADGCTSPTQGRLKAHCTISRAPCAHAEKISTWK